MSGYKVNFSANDAGFSGTVSKIKSSLNSMDDNVRKVEKSMSSSFSAMAVAGGAFAAGMTAINAGISLVKSSADNFAAAMDMGGALSDLSGRTGETAGNLLILQRAFDNTGAGAEKVGPTINRLQKALVEAGQGASGPTEAFNRLGINFEELAGKTPTEQLQELAAKLSDVQDPAERSTLAMQLLGKSGGELLPLFSGFSEEVQTAKDQLGSLPEVMDRSAGAFDQLGDGIEVVKGKATELAAGFLESLLPALNQLVGAGSTFDAAELGKNFGLAVAPLVEAITNGDIWEIFKINGELAIAGLLSSNVLTEFASKFAAMGGFLFGDFNFDENAAEFKAKMTGSGEEWIQGLSDELDYLWEKQGELAKKSAGKFNAELANEQAIKSAEEIYASIDADRAKRRIEAEQAAVDVFAEADKISAKSSEAIRDASREAGDSLKSGAEYLITAAEKLSLSADLMSKINDSEAKSRIDRGGKLEGRINDAINSGDFRKARREADKLREAEDEQKIRDFFTDDPFAKTTSKIKMSLKDLARKEGVETFGKTPDEIRDALLDKMREREKGMDAKQRGKTKEEAARDANKGQPAADPLKVIVNTVEQIKQLLAKIEPKLPTPALGA